MSELHIPHIDEMAGLLYPDKKGLSLYHSATMDVAFLPPGADGAGCRHGVIIWEPCMACEWISRLNSVRHCHNCGQDSCICPAPLLQCNHCGARVESLVAVYRMFICPECHRRLKLLQHGSNRIIPDPEGADD